MGLQRIKIQNKYKGRSNAFVPLFIPGFLLVRNYARVKECNYNYFLNGFKKFVYGIEMANTDKILSPLLILSINSNFLNGLNASK
jgi:hypothetical protein